MKYWILTATCLGVLVGCQSVPHSTAQTVALPIETTTVIANEEAQSRPNLINFEQIKQQQHQEQKLNKVKIFRSAQLLEQMVKQFILLLQRMMSISIK